MNSDEKLAMENLAYLDYEPAEGISGRDDAESGGQKETAYDRSTPVKTTVELEAYDPKEELKVVKKEANLYKNITCCMSFLVLLLLIAIIMLFVGLIPSIRDNFIGALGEVIVTVLDKGNGTKTE
jgi:hypothetical protein